MIEIQNVRKSFGDRESFKGIDMTVPTGSVTGYFRSVGERLKQRFLRTLNVFRKS